MREKVDAVVRWALVLLMTLLVLDVVWQVVSRYIIGSPSTFTDELARFLLIWVSLLGAAYASGRHMHIAIDVFPNSLEPGARRRLELLVDVLVIGFVLLVPVIGGGMVVYYTFTYLQLTPTLQIPMAFVYLIGPISGLLIIFYKLSDIRRRWRGAPPYVRESDPGTPPPDALSTPVASV
jgi:TRAP-type C4-dicarboxylate transport system permease small subunit